VIRYVAVTAEIERVTISHVGSIIPGEEPCGPCGTIAAWVPGVPMPLCTRHRGVLLLAALVLDEEGDDELLRGALTA
jgi:hypothetical protein